MRFEEWEPYYIQILDYFGFSRAEDERAAHLLQTLVPDDDFPILEALCRGNRITVCGNAPCLIHELDQMEGAVFAADGAANILYAEGIRPDAVFTDLDGATERYVEMNRKGTIMVVHAHGDNIPLLSRWVPRFPGPVVATTQSRPLSGVYNFGGFSDGDRAVFAADALGAAAIRIIGFDLDDPDVDPVKHGKLLWARTLLNVLGYEL
jgi:uncharacterized Rossmann fold enzyme